MRAPIPEYELRAPLSLAEALDLLAHEPGAWRPFAGGTDLMVLLEAGKLAHRRYVSLWNLSELRGIREEKDHVTLGALATYRDVLESRVIARDLPNLRRAAEETGAVAIQNRGTIGGNIANASPAADTPPALLVYDAEIELVSAGGTRRVPYATFHTGYKKTVMREDEIIARIRVPRARAKGVHHYRKVGTRLAQAISKVVIAGWADVDGGGKVRDIAIALGSVAPTTVRCPKTEALVKGQAVPLAGAVIEAARAEVLKEIAPVDDIRSTAAYRRRVSQNLVAEFLGKLGAPGK